MIDALERETILKVANRLLPCIFLCYFVCLIDLVNLSFAALTMNKDLGLSAYAYSLSASIFSSVISFSRFPPIWRWNDLAPGCGSPASW